MIVYGHGRRFVVSEIVGVTIPRDAQRGGKRPSLDLAILDLGYCYREVAHVNRHTSQRRSRRADMRAAALAICDRLNAEDELQAREGTVSC